MSKSTIKNMVLLLIFLVTTFNIPSKIPEFSKIRHSLDPIDAGILKLYCGQIKLTAH